MRQRLGVIVAIAALGFTACPDENNDNNKNNTNNTPAPDMNQADMKPAPDMPDQADMGDMSDMDDMAQLQSCTISDDCSPEENCLGGFCRTAQPCEGPSQWGVCGAQMMMYEPTALERSACINKRCRITCVIDSECGQGKACGDDGQCIDFEGQVTGQHPGAGTRAPFKAGVGNRLLNFPIGLPAAGYGGGNSRGGRYTEAMSETWGEMHGLWSRAVVMDNGERQLAIVRLPFVFPTAPLHEAVSRKLQEATGADWRDSLLLSGTHTHSGPGRMLHLPGADDSALPLGPLGTDLFHQQAFDWYAESITQTVLDAIADLAPSKLSWHVFESFDTDDAIASDRWGATPPFDDNRVLFMRIDDMQDKPRVVMMSFGMHGTWNSDRPYLSEDAAGSVERGLEAKLGQEYDRHIPTMFINANGGSMSPRGDRRGHQEGHKFEYMGQVFGDRVFETVKNMQGKTDVSLGGVTHRFPIRFDDLGYEDGQFVDLRRKTDNLRYGGLQCSIANAEDDDPTTHAPIDEVRCLGLHTILYNRPPTIFVRSQVSALEIDGLTVVTLPGESVQELGWQVARELREVHNIDPFKSWVIGYAQDHKFYMTPENLRGELPPYPGISLPKAPDEYPDYAISYFQGGYEAGFMPWGYRFADFVTERVMESVAKLRGTPMQMKLPEVLPLTYSRRDQTFAPMDISSAAVGSVIQEMPAQVSRLTLVEFGWVGGDPGAEMPQVPQVVLERELGDGSFEPVMQPSKRPYDNRDALMVTRTRKTDTDWEWLVYWEEVKSFPAGKYRFNVSGHYLSDQGIKDYSLTSRTFELIPSDDIQIDATADLATNTLSGTIAYPAAENFEVIGPLTDPGQAKGSFRMRHPEVPTGSPDPVVPTQDLTPAQLTITVSQGGQVVETIPGDTITLSMTPETVNGRQGVPVTRFSYVRQTPIPSGNYELTISVTDNHGNTGAQTVPLNVP